MKRFFYRLLKPKVSKARRESNIWLKQQTADIKGEVLSIGSGDDGDHEGGRYRDYFKNCSSYTTSDIPGTANCDMYLDVRSMSQIQDNSYDCIFCSGVLEHVDNYLDGLKEITRVLKPDGILLLGLPFRQAMHMAPNDYWRFTEHGIRHMLERDYAILELTAIDNSAPEFPAAYWVKAKKQ